MYQIFLLPQAEDDLSNIVEYLATNASIQTANNFLYEFLEKIDLIKSTPYIFAVAYQYPKYRRFLIGNFAIFYDVLKNKKQIDIVAILHCAQDIPNLLK